MADVSNGWEALQGLTGGSVEARKAAWTILDVSITQEERDGNSETAIFAHLNNPNGDIHIAVPFICGLQPHERHKDATWFRGLLTRFLETHDPTDSGGVYVAVPE